MYREDVPLHVLYSSGTTPTTTRETWTEAWSLKAIRRCGRDCVDCLAQRPFVVDVNGQCKRCADTEAYMDMFGQPKQVGHRGIGHVHHILAGGTHCICIKCCGSTTMPPCRPMRFFWSSNQGSRLCRVKKMRCTIRSVDSSRGLQ